MSPVDVSSHDAHVLRPPEQELDVCASFLLRHGLQLTALELAQEMQDLHGEAALCATLRNFLMELPSVVLAGVGLANGDCCREVADSLGALPMGAAERTMRPWDERTLLLEYELRICKADLAQTEERCQVLQKELDKAKVAAVELQSLGDGAGTSDAGSSGGSSGDNAGQDSSIPEPQERCTLEDLQSWRTSRGEDPGMVQECSLQDIQPLQEGEHGDALVDIVLGVSGLVPFLPDGKKILMAPVLTRCALLQPKLLGSSVACLLPQLIPTERSSRKSADVIQGYVGLADMRRAVIGCEVELALQLDQFAVEVLPALLRDGSSRHEIRRAVIAELCGVLGVVAFTRLQGGDGSETHVATSICATLRALLRDSAPSVRAMAAAALARYISALGSCDAPALGSFDVDIQRLCLDSSVEVLSRCRRSVLPRIASLSQRASRPTTDATPTASDGSDFTAFERVVDCGQKRLLFPALHSARMCAHTLARRGITLRAERGLWVLRLRLFLELLLACLPTLVSALATALAQDEAVNEDHAAILKSSPCPWSAASLIGDLGNWEGEWAPLEGASAQQAAAEDDELDAWLGARLAGLAHNTGPAKSDCCDGTPAEKHPPYGGQTGWLADDAIAQLRTLLLAHATSQGFLPFKSAWHEGPTPVVKLLPLVNEFGDCPADLPSHVQSFLQDIPKDWQLVTAMSSDVVSNDSAHIELATDAIAAVSTAVLASPEVEAEKIPRSRQEKEISDIDLAKQPLKEAAASTHGGSEVQAAGQPQITLSPPRVNEPDTPESPNLLDWLETKATGNGTDPEAELERVGDVESRSANSVPVNVTEHATGHQGQELDQQDVLQTEEYNAEEASLPVHGDSDVPEIRSVANHRREMAEAVKRPQADELGESTPGSSPAGESLSEARRRAQMFIRDSDSSDSDDNLGSCFEATDSDDERERHVSDVFVERGRVISEVSAGNKQANQAARASAGSSGPVAAEVDPLNEWLRPSGVAALTQARTWWESGRNLVDNLMEDLRDFPEEDFEDVGASAHFGGANRYPDGREQPPDANNNLSRESRSSIVSVSSVGEEAGRRVSDLSSDDIHAFLESAMQSDETFDHGDEPSNSQEVASSEALLSGVTSDASDGESGTPTSLATAAAQRVLSSAAVPMPSPPPLSMPMTAPAADALLEDLCPPLTFCTNSWVSAVVEIAGLLDLCDAENTPVLDALCHTLMCLSQLLGKDFKHVVVERQLTQVLAPLRTKLHTSSSVRNHKESLEFRRATKILPVYCRIVVATWSPEQAVDWLICMTLTPGLNSQDTRPSRALDHLGSRDKDDWAVQRWLWCELAGQEQVHAAMLERAIWPAIGGELGPGARTAAACALDALTEVMKPAALLRHVLPAVFALSDSSVEDVQATEAAMQALVPLASVWARLDQLGFEAEERITVHFHDVTEHGGPRLAQVGAQQLRRLASLPGASRNVIVSVFSAAMRLTDLEAYARCSGVQVALAETLMALLVRSELTSQPVGVAALRATASVICMREPLLQTCHADLNGRLCRRIASLQQL